MAKQADGLAIALIASDNPIGLKIGARRIDRN